MVNEIFKEMKEDNWNLSGMRVILDWEKDVVYTYLSNVLRQQDLDLLV
jgi:transposase